MEGSIYLTHFIGRKRETDEIKAVLSSRRLLTLIGMGGVGKTRLALKVAEESVNAFPDGIWVVELAQVAESTQVALAVASTMGVREEVGVPLLLKLQEFLKGRIALLILDNCEHVLPDSAELAVALLKGSPEVKIVASSREPLGVEGETCWQVPPLSMPDINQAYTPEQLLEFEAVQLFIDRARELLPDFELTHLNSGAVARICRRLDGLPLALELAASRVKLMTPDEIVRRLDHRFRLLVGGRASLPRHKTLRATLDWSTDLLTDVERHLWFKLSVFIGGFPLSAVEKVCSSPEVPEEEILALLGQLVSKSLVFVEPRGFETRYFLPESIRDYCREHLALWDQKIEFQSRHQAWCMDVVEAAAKDVAEPSQLDQLEILAGLDSEQENIRSALHRSELRGDIESIQRFASGLSWYWYHRGNVREGRRWIDAVLSVPGAMTPHRIQLMDQASRFALWVGNVTEGLDMAKRALAAQRQLGDTKGIVSSLNTLGLSEISQALYSDAISTLEQALSMARQVGENRILHAVLSNLGIARRLVGDYETAINAHEESLKLKREIRDNAEVSSEFANIAAVLRLQRKYHKSAQTYLESLCLARPSGNTLVIIKCLEGLASIWKLMGNVFEAARVLGGAQWLRFKVGMAPTFIPDPSIPTLESFKQFEPAEMAWNEGGSTGPDAVIEMAIHIANAIAGHSEGQRLAASARIDNDLPVSLTMRERELLTYVPMGLTLKEIGYRLQVSPRTVEKHEENLRAKLKLPNRASLAVWAAQHGFSDPSQTK